MRQKSTLLQVEPYTTIWRGGNSLSKLECAVAATHAHRTHSHNPADEEAAATERDAGGRGIVFSAQSRALDCPALSVCLSGCY